MKATAAVLGSALLWWTAGGVASAQPADLLERLNANIDLVRPTSRSYRVLLDAYLDLTPAPTATGGVTDAFNLNEIWPGMDNWEAVADWAESNPHMAEAILEAREKKIFGLPYGSEGLPESYIAEDLVALVGEGDELRETNFGFMRAMDLIAAYATAETYRLFEAGETEAALDLAVAEIYVLDQLCDRRFLEEKLDAIYMLTDFLECLRDMMYLYRDDITQRQFAYLPYDRPGEETTTGLAGELPFLRPDLLEMPDGDRLLAETLLERVFNDNGSPDPEAFVDTFTELQAEEKPLTRFGAARRWRMIALVHSSYTAAKERLKLIYDDWIRRWDIRAHDPLLDLDSQYKIANRVRYAAVVYAVHDIEEIFAARRLLRTAVNGTTIAAGLNAYYKAFGTYPSDIEMIYAQFVLKRHNLDPFDREEGLFGYTYYPNGKEVLTPSGFVRIEGPLLWSKGQDYESNDGLNHMFDGSGTDTDIVLWPPLRALGREQGAMD